MQSITWNAFSVNRMNRVMGVHMEALCCELWNDGGGRIKCFDVIQSLWKNGKELAKKTRIIIHGKMLQMLENIGEKRKGDELEDD